MLAVMIANSVISVRIISGGCDVVASMLVLTPDKRPPRLILALMR